jgi:glycosyltransferase involved in cell wall biosynthesis
VFRHSLFELYKYGLRSLVFPRADLAIANSSYEERALHEDFPEFKNIKLLPEGMDANEVRDVKRHPEEPNRILYVGVLKGYKNVDKILEGFSFFLRKESARSKLVIVGDGPEYEFLVAYARSLGLDTFVEWKHGLSREQLLDEYARASVFILLSHLESFGRVVYDALLIGVPAVVLNFGALKDLVSTGLVIGVDSLNPPEIAHALSEALKRNPPRFSNQDKMFLEWPEYSRRIISVYDDLVGRKSGITF